MGEVRAETVIDAPPDAVWEVLSDVSGWAEWNDVMIDGRCSGGEGARVSCKVAVGPIWFPVDSKMRTWHDAQEMAWGEDMGRILRVNHGFTLERRGEAGTAVVHFERFEGAIGRLVYPLIRRSLTKNYAEFLRALKQRVETSPPR